MADDTSQSHVSFERLSDTHKQDLAARVEDSGSFISRAAELGFSETQAKELLEGASSFLGTETTSTQELLSTDSTTTDKLTDKLTHFAKHVNENDHHINHAYVHHALEQERKDWTWNIDVEGDNFEDITNKQTGGRLGDDEGFRKFWDDEENGYEASLKKASFAGLNADELEVAKLDLRDQMRRNYLYSQIKPRGTFAGDTASLRRWNFTYTSDLSQGVQKQKGFLERSVERGTKQEQHFVQNNLLSASYKGAKKKEKVSGKKLSVPTGSLLENNPRFAAFFQGNDYKNANEAQRQRLLWNFYNSNKQYILTNYQGLFPKGFKPPSGDERRQLEQMSLKQLYLQRKKIKLNKPKTPTTGPVFPTTQPLGSSLPRTGPLTSTGYGDLNRKTDLRSAWKHGAKKLARNAIRRDIKTRRQATLPGLSMRILDRLGLEASFLAEDLAETFSPVVSPIQSFLSDTGSLAQRQTQKGVGNLRRNFLPRISSALQRGAGRGINNGLERLSRTTRNISRLVNRVREIAQVVRAAQAAGAAIGFLAGGGWIIIVVLLVLLILIIIIMIIIQVMGGGAGDESKNHVTYSYIKCTDAPSQPDSLPVVARELKSKFDVNTGINGIDFSAYPGRFGYPAHTFDETTALQELSVVYDTACILFGHVNGQTADNTFGKLYKGTGQSNTYDATSHSEDVNMLLTDKSTTYQNCSTHPLEFSNNQREFKFTIENPDKCDPTHFEFLIARTLARAVAIRAKDYSGASNVFDLFQKGPFTSEGLIPTDACQTYKSAEECFADAVGAYLIYLPNGSSNVCLNGNGKNSIWLNSASHGEFDPHMDWISGQCSQASLSEVLNAYGGNNGKLYTIVQVASQSQQLGVWDNYFHSQQGGNPGSCKATHGGLQGAWELEACHFNMNIEYHEYAVNSTNLDSIIQAATSGHPVIVSAPNHYLVIWGGDAQNVWTLDSSGHDYTWSDKSTADSITIGGPNHHGKNGKPLTRQEFVSGGFDGFSTRDNTTQFVQGDETGYWTGVAIILTPQNGSSSSCQQNPANNNSTSLADQANAIVRGISSDADCKVLKSSPWKSIYGGSNSSVGSDVACLDTVNPAIAAAAKTIMNDGVNRASNGFLQCDDFVRAVAAQAGVPFNNNLHIARNYRGSGTRHGAPTSGVPSGYTWVDKDSESTTPMKPGNIAIWSFAPWGHIAIVTSVNAPFFQVAEGNGDGQGSVDISQSGHYSIDDPGFAGWLVKQ